MATIRQCWWGDRKFAIYILRFFYDFLETIAARFKSYFQIELLCILLSFLERNVARHSETFFSVCLNVVRIPRRLLPKFPDCCSITTYYVL